MSWKLVCIEWFVSGAAESDMDLDLLAESESDSESSHSNQDNVSVQRSAVTAATAGSDAGNALVSTCTKCNVCKIKWMHNELVLVKDYQSAIDLCFYLQDWEVWPTFLRIPENHPIRKKITKVRVSRVMKEMMQTI